MKRLLIASATTLALVAAAAAQTSTTTTTTTGSTPTVTVEPEVRTKVRQYITSAKPKTMKVPAGVTITRGAVLPETVEVQSFPADVGVTQYRFAVVDDRAVLVDNSRRIVEVIE